MEIETNKSVSISYDRLWKLLVDKKMKKKDLQLLTHLSSAVIAKLGKNQPVHLNTIVKICDVLHCNIMDVVELKTPLRML